MNYPQVGVGNNSSSSSSSSSYPPQMQFPPSMMPPPLPMMMPNVMDPSFSSYFPYPMANSIMTMHPHPHPHNHPYSHHPQGVPLDENNANHPSNIAAPTSSNIRSIRKQQHSKKQEQLQEHQLRPHICTVHPLGLPFPFDLPFPERRLPVCDKCKKNFKSRDLCRKRDGHKALPWQTTYVVVTLDDSALLLLEEEMGSASGGENNISKNDDNHSNDAAASNTISDSSNILVKNNDDPNTTTTTNPATSLTGLIHHPSPPTAILLPSPPPPNVILCTGPSDGSMSTEPICKLCREKNYTRDYCRNTCQHTYPPWSTTYVKLVVLLDDRYPIGVGREGSRGSIGVGGGGGKKEENQGDSGMGNNDNDEVGGETDTTISAKHHQYSMPAPTKRRKNNPVIVNIKPISSTTPTSTTASDVNSTDNHQQEDTINFHHMNPNVVFEHGATIPSSTTTITKSSRTKINRRVNVEEGEEHHQQEQHTNGSVRRSDDLTKIHPSKTFLMAMSSKETVVRVSSFVRFSHSHSRVKRG